MSNDAADRRHPAFYGSDPANKEPVEKSSRIRSFASLLIRKTEVNYSGLSTDMIIIGTSAVASATVVETLPAVVSAVSEYYQDMNRATHAIFDKIGEKFLNVRA